jgi:broad specificity phosphatase PhoE
MADDSGRFFLIRHGETEFNRLGIFRGRYEVDLNDRGRRQAGEIGAALEGEGIDLLLASPLSRAVETAAIIGRSIGVEHKVDEAFNNIALGEWQGVEKKKIQRDHPEEWRMWTTEPERLVIPGGETIEQVRTRAFARLVEITRRETGTFAVVTHRSVIKTLAASLLGVPAPYFWKFYIDNAAFSVFSYGDSGFTLLSWNSNHHLSENVTEVF